MNESQDGQPPSGATRFGDHADRHDDATQALPVDDSRSDPSTGKAPAQDGDRPRLDVGVIVSPSVKSVTRESVGADLGAELSQRYAQIDWNVVVVADRLEEPPVMPLDLMESARDRMLDEDWDLVLVLTDFPLKDGRRVVKTQLSPVHGVGLVVVPALGVVQVPTRVRKACLTLVEEILDEPRSSRRSSTSTTMTPSTTFCAALASAPRTSRSTLGRTRLSSPPACSAGTSASCSGSCVTTGP